MKFSLATLLLFGSVGLAPAADWTHWRGPEQTGESKEKNLPADFDPAGGKGSNVLWKAPFGGRSSPLILDGRAYIVQGAGEGVNEGEQILCVDANTGKKIASDKFNVFHTDIVSVRLGWCTLTADPATKTIYIHSTAGLVIAYDKDLKKLWERSLTEEFGRISGYGGRIVSPIFDSGNVIVGMVNSSWGDQARAATRYVALDGKTGQVAWWAETPNPIKGTYYSNPVIAVINGQRLLITGGGDGFLHAFNVRTGERVFSHQFSAGVVNPSPVVDGNLIYICHGEENPEGAPIGRVICVDGSQVDAATKTPKVVWDTFRKPMAKNRNQPLAARFGLASPALAEGKLYIPDDGGELFCFDAKTGTMDWKVRYATEVRGAPLVADGKLYIFDVKAKMWIMTLNKDRSKAPTDLFDVTFPSNQGRLSETNGTPIAVNGKIYFNTRNEMYCLANEDAKPTSVKYKPLAAEPAFDPKAKVAGLRIFPADVTAAPGEIISFTVTSLDQYGRELPNTTPTNVQWTLPLPPKTPTGAQPPALKGSFDEGNGSTRRVALDNQMPTQQGYVEAKFGDVSARARVRVAAKLPYAQNFDRIPQPPMGAGPAPGGWVNATGKYTTVTRDGNVVLSKVNSDSRPPFARANAYITTPEATGYAIQADVLGTEVRQKLADIGVVANRYTLILDGKVDPDRGKRQLRLVSWEARPRINEAIDFDWNKDTWYTLKLQVDVQGDKAIVRGKVFEKGKEEPKWQIEFTDPSPNKHGAAALYGYVSNVSDDQPGSEIFYDNVKITPNTSGK